MGNDRKPKILVFDIETAPIAAHVWKIWEENVGINQIISDWHLLSWAAKWTTEKETRYMDQRHEKNIENDRRILEGLWKLLDEADVLVTQNGKRFDVKKINTRFAIHGMKPPSPYKHVDTLQLAKKNFSFTSNSLEFLAGKLCVSNQKRKSKKFPGFLLWSECMKGNKEAWKEMEIYNRLDVLATEELYNKLKPWGTNVDLNPYYGDSVFRCVCGGAEFMKRGFIFTTTGKHQRYLCRDCGAWTSDRGKKRNLIDPDKKDSMRGPTKPKK